MKNNNCQLILASNSPRRKELVAGLDIPYEIVIIQDIDESYPDSIPLNDVAEYLAIKKSQHYPRTLLSGNVVLLTADTIVLVNSQILGKPVDKADAKRMLRMLSGKTHEVITGVCLASSTKQTSFSDTTRVTFANLTDEEIDYYVEKHNPQDKAGAYGVQEWIGYVAVTHLDGSYFNVMGLPIHRVYQELNNLLMC